MSLYSVSSLPLEVIEQNRMRRFRLIFHFETDAEQTIVDKMAHLLFLKQASTSDVKSHNKWVFFNEVELHFKHVFDFSANPLFLLCPFSFNSKLQVSVECSTQSSAP